MDLTTIAWILGGWLLVSVVVSLAVGRMFRQVSLADAELERAVEQQWVVRYLRRRKPPTQKAAKPRAAVHRAAAI